MHILLRIALALAGTQLCVPLGAHLIVLDNNEYRNEQCTEGPYCFSYRSLTVRASGHWILSVFHSCNFLLRHFFCVNYKALGKRRMWLGLSIKCSFQLRNPTPEIETLLWRGVRGRVVEGSIACSPFVTSPPFLLPVACQSMQLQLLFDFVFDFAFVLWAAGKRASRGKGGGANWPINHLMATAFGLVWLPRLPLWSPHMCQYLCEMRLQSHRHKTLSIILGGRCGPVCV